MLNEQYSEDTYLHSLSALSGRRFDSTESLIAAILPIITAQLGLRTSFITRISPEQHQNHILAAHNEPEGCDLAAGSDLVLEDTF